jgi:hypothetical protein
VILTKERLGHKVSWLAPLLVWAAWGCAGYVLVARVLEEIRAIQWQYAHPALDWIANQVQLSGQVSFLLTLLLLAVWCAGAYPLYRWTASPRRER